MFKPGVSRWETSRVAEKNYLAPAVIAALQHLRLYMAQYNRTAIYGDRVSNLELDGSRNVVQVGNKFIELIGCG